MLPVMPHGSDEEEGDGGGGGDDDDDDDDDGDDDDDDDDDDDGCGGGGGGAGRWRRLDVAPVRVAVAASIEKPLREAHRCLGRAAVRRPLRCHP